MGDICRYFTKRRRTEDLKHTKRVDEWGREVILRIS